MRTVLAVVAILLTAIRAAAAEPAVTGNALDLVAEARAQIGVTVIYDSGYQRIAYPMGDVPPERGVCTDVVIRAFRALGLDLQAEVHRDMAAHFAAYPKLWGLKRPDSNIDHRRVPNLATWLKRQGKAVAVSEDAADYRPGDIVTWTLPGNLPHIGIVSDRGDPESGRPLVIHNIGGGTQEEDRLFDFAIAGHYRWF